jgi:hypothetical protein
MRRTRWARTTAALAASLVVASCAGGQDADVAAPEPAHDEASDGGWETTDGGVRLTVETAEDHDTDQAADDVGAGDDVSAGGEVPPPGPTTTTAATLGRRVIRTATLELESADPNRLAQEVARTVQARGGFVATSDLRRDDQGVLRGTVTVRVPSEGLDATLDELEALADHAPVRRVDERDVTVEAADLEAELANLTAYESELRALLGDVRETTSRPEDLLTVFERVRSVRSEIDQLQGRLAVLADQVSLATITVTIAPTRTVVAAADPGWAPGDTAREALASALRTLRGLADAAIWLTLAVLPVLAVFGLPLLAALWAWRHRRTATPPADGPPTTATSPPVA